MSAGRICSRIVATASPTESARDAARRMAVHDVGTLVVVTDDGIRKATGILTDRDIATRVVAAGLDPETTPVAAVMTAPVRSISEETPIEEAVLEMARATIRRLIVTDDQQRPVGILSLDDVLDLLIGEFGPVRKLLERQGPHIMV